MKILSINSSFKNFYHSLRGKLIIASAIAGLILALGSALTHLYINQSSTDATLALQQRINKLKETRVIMDNIWDVSFFLGEHSIAPSKATRALIYDKMILSVKTLLTLIELEGEDSKPSHSLQLILSDLGQLGIYINQLLEIRANPATLFPAIQVSRTSMFESQNIFSQLVALSIDDLSQSLSEADTETFLLLMDLRYKWSQVVSYYRMYLLNRLALLNKNDLKDQVESINLLVEVVNKEIVLLKKIDEQGRLDFQTSASLPELVKAKNIWLDNFRNIVKADTPEKWRKDYPIIKTKIAPLMESIWKAVLDYDENIELSVKKSMNDVSNVATNTSYLLWIVLVSGLLLLVMMLYFIDTVLLQPIQQISMAMRQEAHDGRYLKPLIIKGKSLEAENLIDAFSTMQLQVHNRKNDLEYQALHDHLTSLPNRVLLFDRLQQAITKAKRDHTCISLVMMDLNRFKEINDTLGHHAGDQLLQQISLRLVETLRSADTVARLGGDEFAILIPDSDANQSIKVAQKVRQCMQPAIQVNDQSLYIHGSLGIANFPEHGADAETLLKNADIAMYLAKRNNSVYEIYDHEQDMHSLFKLELKHRLQAAIQNDELELYYQPQLNCQTFKIVAVEALLRWNSKESGAVAPDVFIPLAEESGLMKDLTEWVIKAAAQQQNQWKCENINIHMSINLSAWNLLDPDLDEFIFDHFKKYDFSSGSVSFEITESAMMEDTEQALKMMRSLNQNGFNIIVDDYGTGFSSLAYLKRFPVKELKIDKSFVINMIENENDQVIVKSTIELAHNLGLLVVAEGVETKEVLEKLRQLGCDTAQGYYIARPLPAGKMKQWYLSHLPQSLMKLMGSNNLETQKL